MATLVQTSGRSGERPVLELSGTKLRIALERLVNASESLGGVERFAEAVRLKSSVLQERLADGKAATLSRGSFEEIVPLLATVRRRIGPLLEGRACLPARGDRPALGERARYDDHRPAHCEFRERVAQTGSDPWV